MKIFIVAFTTVATNLATLAHAQTQQLPSQQLLELRSAVQQSQLRTVGATAAVAPRQLSDEERALLRRQVREQSAKSRS